MKLTKVSVIALVAIVAVAIFVFVLVRAPADPLQDEVLAQTPPEFRTDRFVYDVKTDEGFDRVRSIVRERVALAADGAALSASESVSLADTVVDRLGVLVEPDMHEWARLTRADNGSIADHVYLSDGKTFSPDFQKAWERTGGLFTASPIASEEITVRRVEVGASEDIGDMMSEIMDFPGQLMRFLPAAYYPTPENNGRARVEVLIPMKFAAISKDGDGGPIPIPAVVIMRYVESGQRSGWSPYASFVYFGMEATKYRIPIPVF